MIEIQNENLALRVDPFGAQMMELRSRQGTQFLWNGGEKYWRDRAPVLFPYVARMTDGSYTLCGERYSMDIHGFAKDSGFSVEEQTVDSVTLRLSETPETLRQYPDLSDALIRRILKYRNQYESFSQFADLLKTRDITRSAICRGLVRIFLDLKEKAPGHIPYARVLGFRKDSAPLLGQIKKSTSIPMLTKAADASSILDKDGLGIFNKTCEASNLYEMLLCRKTGQPFIHEFQKSPRIIL